MDLTPTQAKLGSLRLGYPGQVAARGLSLVDSVVSPAWPRKEHTGLLPVVRFLDGEVLKPVEQWPSVTPFGHVMASDEEWGLRLGLMDTVDEVDIFRDHNGKLVLNGEMGVPKLKRLPDGSTVEVAVFHLELGTCECLLSPHSG